jgi:hypothetical protein
MLDSLERSVGGRSPWREMPNFPCHPQDPHQHRPIAGPMSSPGRGTTSLPCRELTAFARISNVSQAGPSPTSTRFSGCEPAKTSTASMARTNASSLRSSARRETMTIKSSSSETGCRRRNAPRSIPGLSRSTSMDGSITQTPDCHRTKGHAEHENADRFPLPLIPSSRTHSFRTLASTQGSCHSCVDGVIPQAPPLIDAPVTGCRR